MTSRTVQFQVIYVFEFFNWNTVVIVIGLLLPSFLTQYTPVFSYLLLPVINTKCTPKLNLLVLRSLLLPAIINQCTPAFSCLVMHGIITHHTLYLVVCQCLTSLRSCLVLPAINTKGTSVLGCLLLPVIITCTEIFFLLALITEYTHVLNFCYRMPSFLSAPLC